MSPAPACLAVYTCPGEGMKVWYSMVFNYHDPSQMGVFCSSSTAKKSFICAGLTQDCILPIVHTVGNLSSLGVIGYTILK